MGFSATCIYSTVNSPEDKFVESKNELSNFRPRNMIISSVVSLQNPASSLSKYSFRTVISSAGRLYGSHTGSPMKYRFALM